MLEKLELRNKAAIDYLRNTIGGTNLQEIDLRKESAGLIIRVTTDTGNCYFFELTEEKRQAHVFRCDGRQGAAAGYRGKCGMEQILEVGQKIKYKRPSEKKSSDTHAARKIELIIPDQKLKDLIANGN